MFIPLKLQPCILQSLYDNSVQVYPKNQLLQRATVNSESGTTLGGGRLEGFVQMFLLPFVT